jgi:glycosyltransferase involved in cell wall biosynthesis
LKILFLIRNLDTGGAERQLIELVRHLDKTHFQPIIVTFYNGGSFWHDLDNNPDIKLISLNKSGRWDIIGFFTRLMKIIKEEKPALIHGYLDVPNLFSLLAGKLNRIKVVWGLRASNMDLSQYDWTARFLYWLCQYTSYLTDLIIVNSNAGKTYHVSRGFQPERMVVIPNGFDTQRLYPDLDCSKKQRETWKINDEMILIGQIGRLDPMKNPENFIQAAALVSQKNPHARFVYVGDVPGPYHQKLVELMDDLGLGSQFLWAGKQTDMKAVYNALDFLCLSSDTEGFPNVVGEAMACGKPCVVTDVGDAALIVGETGIVIPPKDASLLAEGLERLINTSIKSRGELGIKARQRIETLFSVQALAVRSGQIFLDLIGNK